LKGKQLKAIPFCKSSSLSNTFVTSSYVSVIVDVKYSARELSLSCPTLAHI